MKVVLFSEIVPEPSGKCLNGIARHIQVLKHVLPILGCSVTIVAPGEKKHPDPMIVTIPGKLKKEAGDGYLLAKPWSLVGRKKMNETLIGADIYHAHHPSQMAVYGAIKARLHQIPVILTWHTYYVEYASFYSSDLVPTKTVANAVRSALRLARMCTVIIAPSQAAAEYARESAKLEKTPIEIIPTAVEVPDSALLSKSARKMLRKLLQIPEECLIITSSGRQGYEKGFIEVVESFAKIYEQYPNTRLVLAGGEGFATKELHELAEKLQLEEVIYFPGHLENELSTLYAESSFVMSASCYETQGLTIQEAAACGTPAIVVNQGGVAEQVEEGVTGLIVDPIPDALAEAAIELLNNPKRTKSMGEAALNKVRNYTPEDMGKRIVEVYKKYTNS